MNSNPNLNQNNSITSLNSNNLIDDSESLISHSTSKLPKRTLLNEKDQKKIDQIVEKATKVDQNDIIDFEEVSIRRTLFFRLYITGTIEYGNFIHFGDLMGTSPIKVKSEFVYGKDWEKEDGNITEESQFSFKGDGTYNYYSFNNQFEISFRSTNPFGWPQLVLTCCSIDNDGNELVEGYGCVHVPTNTGRHERRVHIFSTLQQSRWIDILINSNNKKRNEVTTAPKVISSGEGREISRVRCDGWIKVIFQISFRDMEKFGLSID